MHKEENRSERQACKYYIRGQCKFGTKCRFSHEVVQAFLMRHAQSVYNHILESSQFDACSTQARDKFQLSEDLIDCQITNLGHEQLKSLKLPKQLSKVDLVFVSPLGRALETLDSLIKSKKVVAKKVIVLPDLSEVLSKICDFSRGLEDKRTKYPSYDFSRVKESWQDSFVDEEYRKKIQKQQKDGWRYLAILEEIFPVKLQNQRRCFERILRAIEEIRSISRAEKAEKIFIVSHNRSLKYIMGRFNHGREDSFENCQIKFTLL